ncbi:MAG: prolipoprotein diacylglyceryl transferase [Deltaproteobacteria bacterium]|nr:prolipoprotein diacylglyceryl transferase [Deltaproteobacteria bacterium]
MWPHDLRLGPLAISPYGLALILAILAALSFLGYTAPRAGTSPRRAFDLAFWLVIAGLLGSRLAYVLLNPSLYAGRPLEALQYWQGGLMFQGGLLAGLLAAALACLVLRLNFLVMADALAPALSLGQAIGRVGCLLAGCCHGRPAPGSFPLALTFPRFSQAPPGIPLYPTQIMECLGLLLITAALMFLLGRSRPAGLVVSAYLALAGLLRFLVDPLRGDYRGPRALGLAPTSWAAMAACLAGLALGLFLLARQKRLARSKIRCSCL